eukprot:gene4818-9610_t
MTDQLTSLTVGWALPLLIITLFLANYGFFSYLRLLRHHLEITAHINVHILTLRMAGIIPMFMVVFMLTFIFPQQWPWWEFRLEEAKKYCITLKMLILTCYHFGNEQAQRATWASLETDANPNWNTIQLLHILTIIDLIISMIFLFTFHHAIAHIVPHINPIRKVFLVKGLVLLTAIQNIIFSSLTDRLKETDEDAEINFRRLFGFAVVAEVFIISLFTSNIFDRNMTRRVSISVCTDRPEQPVTTAAIMPLDELERDRSSANLVSVDRLTMGSLAVHVLMLHTALYDIKTPDIVLRDTV